MSPDLLTTGPRGRRLCLAVACTLDDELAEAARQRAFVLDDGSTMHRFVAAEAGDPPLTQAEIDAYLAAEAARPVPTVADVARLLESVTVPSGVPDQGLLTFALQTAVDAAMYWQPPAGEDVLAGKPELDGGLARIATWLAPHAPDWWRAPMAPEQWTIGWWGHDPREVTQSVTGWREATVAAEERAAAQRRENQVEYPKEGWSPTPGLRPADIDAPIGGIWWSFPDGVSSTRAVGGVPLGLDLTEDTDVDGVSVAPAQGPENPRVLEIDTPRVWVDLCRAHPLDVTASRRHDWYRVTGRDGDWVIPDWAAVAEDYDAVHLTTAAYLAGATRSLEVDQRLATMIAGRGPDATVWLTPVQVGTPRAWSFDREADRAVRWSAS